MKKHTIYGYDILKETVGINHRQALVALQHHERIDGSGYPMGLYKDEIDIFSRYMMFYWQTTRSEIVLGFERRRTKQMKIKDESLGKD